MEQKTKDNIKSILILLCFAAVVIGMYIFSQTEPSLVISCFGIVVFAIGGAMIYGIATEGLKDPRNLIFTILFSYAGLCMIVLPPVLLYVPAMQSLNKTNLAMSFVAFGFFLTGGVVLIAQTARFILLKKKCPVKVIAKCVEREQKKEFETNKKRYREFFYYFSFVYEGQEYKVKDDTASNTDGAVQGFTYDLWINPNNPEQFYRKTIKRDVAMYVMGGIFLVIGLIVFYFTM